MKPINRLDLYFAELDRSTPVVPRAQEVHAKNKWHTIIPAVLVGLVMGYLLCALTIVPPLLRLVRRLEE